MASRTIQQGCQGVEAIGGDCSGPVQRWEKQVKTDFSGVVRTHAMACEKHAHEMRFRTLASEEVA